MRDSTRYLRVNGRRREIAYDGRARGRVPGLQVLAALVVVGATAIALSVAVRDASAQPSPLAARYMKYRVVEQGTGSYSYDSESAQWGSLHVRADYQWRVRFRNILVPRHRGGDASDAIAQIALRKASSAGGHWSISNQGGSGDCARSGPLSLARGDDVGGAIEGHRGKRGLHLVAGPGWFSSSAPYTSDICSGGNFWQAWLISASGAGSSSNGSLFNDPLAVAISIPDTDVGKSHISRPIGPADQSSLYQPFVTDCSGADETCTQGFEWSGTLTMDRLPFRRPG